MNKPIRQLATVAVIMFLALMAAATNIQFFMAPSLNADGRNVRTLYREFGTDRGPIIVSGTSIATSAPVDDPYKFQRTYTSDIYSNVTGYFSTTHNSMTGIEKEMNSVLGGTDSSLFQQRIGQLLTGTEPQGGAVELTLEAPVQEAAVAAMNGRRGAVVALDPHTGAILAQVSIPTYDANSIATHDAAASQAAWDGLNADESRPLIDRAIAGDQYAPGSVFKLVTASAMLENDANLTPETIVEAPTSWELPQSSHLVYNPAQLPCGDGSGQTTLEEAFIESCNTPFAIAGVGLGADAMIEQAEKFGFNKDLSTPLTVTPSRFPEPASDAALAVDSFGQQDIRVTPMQIAMVTAAIANDGVLMTPYIVKQTLTSDLEPIPVTDPHEFSTPISKKTAGYLTDMMVTNVQRGTARHGAIDGIQVAAKTGTAENPGDALPHAWYAAFAPADDPQIVVVVIVENTEGDGGSTAAPIARQIIQAKLQP